MNSELVVMTANDDGKQCVQLINRVVELHYKISRENGCFVVYGDIPLNELTVLSEAWAKECGNDLLVDATLASAAEATAVFGPTAALSAWRNAIGIDIPDEMGFANVTSLSAFLTR